MDTSRAAWQDLNQRIVACRKCPRLVAWREEVARKPPRAYKDWSYWAKAVPGFGDPQACVLIVGLAPGAHGSNRTGRMFTGDSSGNFLYRALHKVGFANQPVSTSAADGLELTDVYITAVGRCVPPDNRPAHAELLNCRPYLLEEMALLTQVQGIVALGHIAFDNLLEIYRGQGVTLPRLAFAHGALHEIGAGRPWLLTSYHPSRQNTQTGRLTEAMFDRVWETARSLLR